MSDHYDVIVVGAGPAGCAAALRAASLGLRPLLLEKTSFPREKSCGDALSSQAIALVEELGLLDALLREPHVPVHAMSFFSPGGASVTVPMLGLDRSLPVKGIICRRVIFDAMLMEAVRDKAEVLDWCAVRELVLDADGRPRGVIAERGGGREIKATAEAIIAADGALSPCARRLGVPPYPQYRSVCARAYFGYVLGPVGALEFHFLEETLPGLVWIYPTESGLTNVGLSISMEGLRRRRLRPARALLEAIHSPLLRERFAFAEQQGPIQVSAQPTGQTMRRVHGAGFLLVGDAAGLANPCSGEGIAPALLSGIHAAEAVAAGDLDERGLRRYPEALWKELGPGLRLADRLLELRTAKAIDSLVKSARRRPHNAGWISGILVGSSLPSEELSSLLGYLDFFSH